MQQYSSLGCIFAIFLHMQLYSNSKMQTQNVNTKMKQQSQYHIRKITHLFECLLHLGRSSAGMSWHAAFMAFSRDWARGRWSYTFYHRGEKNSSMGLRSGVRWEEEWHHPSMRVKPLCEGTGVVKCYTVPCDYGCLHISPPVPPSSPGSMRSACSEVLSKGTVRSCFIVRMVSREWPSNLHFGHLQM